MSIWRIASEAVTEFGWRNGVLYLASRALQAASRGRASIIKYYFVAQPVLPHMLAPGRAGTGIITYRVDPADPIVQRFPRAQEVITRRFHDGASCFVAVKGDILVGFIWLKPSQYMEDEVRCLYTLEPVAVAAWDFDVWVAPEFRLTRAFARLWDAANAFLCEQGYLWTYSRISAFKPLSLASHRRLGTRHVATGLFLLVGPMQVSLLSCRPFLHFGFKQAHYPELRLRVRNARSRRDGRSDGDAAPANLHNT